MYKRSAVSMMLIFLLTGCASKLTQICPPSSRIELPKADVMAKNSDSVKVIVLPVDVNFKDRAAGKLKSVIREAVEGQVYETGTVLIDRKLADRLGDEIKLAEKSGRYNIHGVPIADYAVLTQVNASNLSKHFKDSYTVEYQDKKGNTHYNRIPSKCSYDVDVKGVVKVVTLPDMKIVDRFEIKGSHSLTTETRRSDCPLSDAEYTSMASKAGGEAISDSSNLKRIYASSAAVIELRHCDVGDMVKISMGRNRKIKPNMAIDFISQVKVDNDDGTSEIETNGYGGGEIINNSEHGIKEKYSWVMIDEDLIPQIKKGDQVKVHADSGKCSLFNLNRCHLF